ncbi:hypothetical protein D3C71_790910 [compost metagenome]
MVDQRAGTLFALLGTGGGQHRDKSLAEGALAQHPPEQIGDTKCHIEGVRHGANPKDGSHEKLSHQPGDAGGKGQKGNGGGGFEQ